jgi:uncharacterized SAM-binding protein YcdF (DUF218 family)
VDRYFLLGLVLAFLALMLCLAAFGWYLRRRKQRDIPSTIEAPTALTDSREFVGFYVSTTSATDPLDRIAVRGLGFRSRTTVIVAAEGIVIPIKGQADVFIPRGDLRKSGRATWTIDRGVEPDGLVVVDWTLGERELASYFRVDEPAGLLDALTELLKTGSDAK